MNSLIVSAPESAAIINGSKTAFVVAVKPQPMRVYRDYYDFNVRNKKYGFYARGTLINDALKDPLLIRCGPYAIGQKVYLREPWAKFSIWDGEGDCPPPQIYYPDSPEAHDLEMHDDDLFTVAIHWQSPATMPRSAARGWIEITGCEVVRCRDMSQNKCIALGFMGTPAKGPAKGNIGTFPYGDFQSYITAQKGQAFWDENRVLFFYTFKLSEK